MEVDMDDCDEMKIWSFTPDLSKNDDKRKLSFQQSNDSGCFTLTPSSREQSYKNSQFLSFEVFNQSLTPQIGKREYGNTGKLLFNFDEITEEKSSISSIDYNKSTVDSSDGGLASNSYSGFIQSSYDDDEWEQPNNLFRISTPYNFKSDFTTDLNYSEVTPIALKSGPLGNIKTALETSVTHYLFGDEKTKTKKSASSKGAQEELQPPRTRFFDSIERVDILYRLRNEQDVPNVRGQILSYLSGDDLLNASRVCKSWESIVHCDRNANKRLNDYKSMRYSTKENLLQVRQERKRSYPTPFTRIENQNVSQSTVSSPIPIERTLEFMKYGEKIGKNDRLTPCPQCRGPVCCAVVKVEDNSYNIGNCEKCGYQFCNDCRSGIAFIKHNCYRVSSSPLVPKEDKYMIIGSRASKRRLSRTFSKF